MTAICAFGLSLVTSLPVIGGADVTIANRLSSGHGMDTYCTLDAGGIVIGLHWQHMPGDAPDTITLTPPPGYWIDAPVSLVPENANRTVRVREIVTG